MELTAKSCGAYGAVQRVIKPAVPLHPPAPQAATDTWYSLDGSKPLQKKREKGGEGPRETKVLNLIRPSTLIPSCPFPVALKWRRKWETRGAEASSAWRQVMPTKSGPIFKALTAHGAPGSGSVLAVKLSDGSAPELDASSTNCERAVTDTRYEQLGCRLLKVAWWRRVAGSWVVSSSCPAQKIRPCLVRRRAHELDVAQDHHSRLAHYETRGTRKGRGKTRMRKHADACPSCGGNEAGEGDDIRGHIARACRPRDGDRVGGSLGDLERAHSWHKSVHLYSRRRCLGSVTEGIQVSATEHGRQAVGCGKQLVRAG